jgi:hypothetical protein
MEDHQKELGKEQLRGKFYSKKAKHGMKLKSWQRIDGVRWRHFVDVLCS